MPSVVNEADHCILCLTNVISITCKCSLLSMLVTVTGVDLKSRFLSKRPCKCWRVYTPLFKTCLRDINRLQIRERSYKCLELPFNLLSDYFPVWWPLCHLMCTILLWLAKPHCRSSHLKYTLEKSFIPDYPGHKQTPFIPFGWSCVSFPPCFSTQSIHTFGVLIYPTGKCL